MGQTGHEFLRSDAGSDVLGGHRDIEFTFHPRRRRVAVGGNADRGRVAPFTGRGRKSLDHHRRRGIERIADREIDHAAVVGGGDRLERVESIVRIGRGRESSAHDRRV